MDTQSARNIGWLAVVNVGIGTLAFLSGLPLLVVFTGLLVGGDNWAARVDQLIKGYFQWVSLIGANDVPVIGITGFALGLVTLILGFITSISLQEKMKRGIAFVGTILGALGMVGNTISIILFRAFTVS